MTRFALPPRPNTAPHARTQGLLGLLALVFATFFVANNALAESRKPQKNLKKPAHVQSRGKVPPKAARPLRPAPVAKPATVAAPGPTAAPEHGARSYAQRPDAMAAAEDIAVRRDLDASWVRRAIGDARLLPSVGKLMLPPPANQKKNWNVYRSRFVEPVRIAAGVRFWRSHQDWLARAEAEFGVPPEIIVGIVGVETIYGQQTGNFRVIDTLATLAFDFPAAHPRAAARQAFFRDELEQFLSHSQRSNTDPMKPRGSYAGAMGWPQFMPSSIVRYAVDFDGDGRIDLTQPADVIGSVANYFKGYGWQPGMRTHYAVRFERERLKLDDLLAPDILPTFSVNALAERGAVVDADGARHSGPLALVELQNGDAAPVYVAGTENFYVITRYNWSSYYAMAVIDLGEAVRAAVSAAGRP